MLPPITSALTPGNALHAATHALTKNDMKPSFTPCAFSKLSLYFARSDMISVMSASLNVVSAAASCCACPTRLAPRLHGARVERGERGCRVLRLHQALSHALAQRRHRDHLVARIDMGQSIVDARPR